eukprot:405516-Amphidinium_carterae.1
MVALERQGNSVVVVCQVIPGQEDTQLPGFLPLCAWIYGSAVPDDMSAGSGTASSILTAPMVSHHA